MPGSAAECPASSTTTKSASGHAPVPVWIPLVVGALSLAAFVARHKPDELMLTANIHDHQARLRSFELAMQAWHARHATVPA